MILYPGEFSAHYDCLAAVSVTHKKTWQQRQCIMATSFLIQLNAQHYFYNTEYSLTIM